MNFGLVDHPPEEWSLSHTSYMAPEQLTQREPTERTDLYSFGVIAYEMVTGQLPFVADNVEELIRLRANAAPIAVRELNANLPPALDRTIADLMTEDPEHRCPSAFAALEAWEQIEPWDTPSP
jgi:serine/threonine-protein kinase